MVHLHPALDSHQAILIFWVFLIPHLYISYLLVAMKKHLTKGTEGRVYSDLGFQSPTNYGRERKVMGASGNWPACIQSQEAGRNGCWCLMHSALFIQFRTLAYEIVPPRFLVGLHTLINITQTIPTVIPRSQQSRLLLCSSSGQPQAIPIAYVVLGASGPSATNSSQRGIPHPGIEIFSWQHFFWRLYFVTFRFLHKGTHCRMSHQWCPAHTVCTMRPGGGENRIIKVCLSSLLQKHNESAYW